MSARFSMRSFALLAATAGTLALGSGATVLADTGDDSAKKTAKATTTQKVLLKGKTTASYFWDDGSGRAGDTGLPASGKPMQKGMAASPSWPLLTEGYVIYNGKKAPFFVGDRGPGNPSNRGIMLDLDAKTFADLTGGKFNPRTLMVDGNGGKGHIKVEYVITKWGDGLGLKNHPVAFSTGAYKRMDRNPATPPPTVLAEDEAEEKAEEKKKAKDEKSLAEGGKPGPVGVSPVKAGFAHTQPVAERKPAETTEAAATGTERSGLTGAAVVGGVALLGGGLVLGRERIRRLVRR